MDDINSIPKRIEVFKQRIKTEPDFCLELFEHATIRLMAMKYAYYVLNEEIIKDYAYDIEEKCWYVMGIALGLLKEDEVSPCVDFDEKHPKAADGIALAKALLRIP